MDVYGKWLQDNNLDPSEPISDRINLNTGDLFYNYLNCDIKDQVIKNHSYTAGDLPAVEGSITRYFAEIGRNVTQAYEFHGEYNCDGIVYAKNYESLNNDIYFSGQGNFVVTASSSMELMYLGNLGITDDQKFNLSLSYPGYFYNVKFESKSVFKGAWNTSELARYIGAIEGPFRTLYREHLIRGDRIAKIPLNPSAVLIQKYLNEILQNANLTEIIGGDIPPYKPTPTTSTTPRSTSTTSTSPSTTSTTTEPGSGTNSAPNTLNNSIITIIQTVAVILISLVRKETV